MRPGLPVWVRVFAVAGALAATTAHARFGKKSEPDPNDEHTATSADPESKSDSSQTHSATGVPSASSQADKNWFWSLFQFDRCGYWSGAYVPWFGYGLRRAADEQLVAPAVSLAEEDPSTRLVVGAESQFFKNGFTISAGAAVEFGRFGLSVSGANISVKADDGTNTTDNLQQVSARLSFAFLTGRYGRWRAEAGADAVFAPDLVVVGPTIGTSGTVWVAGPLAAEGSAYWTFYPYDQLDFRLGAALGLGPFGLRAGWRVQLLSDRGLVDGIVHTDLYNGPYVGLSLAL